MWAVASKQVSEEHARKSNVRGIRKCPPGGVSQRMEQDTVGQEPCLCVPELWWGSWNSFQMPWRMGLKSKLGMGKRMGELFQNPMTGANTKSPKSWRGTLWGPTLKGNPLGLSGSLYTAWSGHATFRDAEGRGLERASSIQGKELEGQCLLILGDLFSTLKNKHLYSSLGRYAFLRKTKPQCLGFVQGLKFHNP